MPRTNAPRSVYAEERLAERVARERERHGWSPEQLSKRMTALGVPVHVSAIYRIETHDRRITVDELIGFSEVFGIPPENLLSPTDLESEQIEALRLAFNAQHEAKIALDEAEAAYRAATTRLDKLTSNLTQ